MNTGTGIKVKSENLICPLCKGCGRISVEHPLFNVSYDVIQSVLERTRKYKRMRADKYVDPRRVLKGDEELETFWSHLHTMEHHYPRLNHNERTIVILTKVFGVGRRVLRDRLGLGRKTVEAMLREFLTYDQVVEPVNPEQL